MKLSRSIIVILLCLAVFTAMGCGGGGPVLPGGGSGTTAYLWCAALKDAHVTSKIPDFSNPGAFSLVLSHGEPNGEQRTYIQFFVPQLPAGTEVKEAYINLWEDSDQGQPGFNSIPIGTAAGDWTPSTITWNDQPNPLGPLSIGTSIGTFISSNMWRTSGDLASVVQGHLDDPATNFGFVFDNTATGAYTRSFASMNALNAREQTSFGVGPRLLMKVESPTELSSETIGTEVPADTELGDMYGFGVDILVYRIDFGGQWPESWEIGAQ